MYNRSDLSVELHGSCIVDPEELVNTGHFGYEVRGGGPGHFGFLFRLLSVVLGWILSPSENRMGSDRGIVTYFLNSVCIAYKNYLKKVLTNRERRSTIHDGNQHYIEE